MKAEMKGSLNLLRARGICELDPEAWWLQGLAEPLETGNEAGNGDALGSAESEGDALMDAESSRPHPDEPAREHNRDQQRIPVVAGGAPPPSGPGERGGGILQQSQEETIPSCSQRNFVYLQAVHTPFVGDKVLEERHNDEWMANGSNCTGGSPRARKFEIASQAQCLRLREYVLTTD